MITQGEFKARMLALQVEAMVNVATDPVGTAHALKAGQERLTDDMLAAGNIDHAQADELYAEIEAGYSMFMARHGGADEQAE